jgi:hypothetical protein
VFSVALSLAIAALSPALPAASVSTDAAIAVCFAPEEDCAAFAVRAIDNAESEILVSAYHLTVGSGVVGALIRAKERGVGVRVIADRTAPCGRASGIDPLAAAGVPIWIDDQARIAHAKRWRRHADGLDELDQRRRANSEDLNLVASRPVAEAYTAHWRERLAVSIPFASREDWCRVSSAEAPSGTR